MSIRPYRDIVRRKSRQVMVGSVPVGGGAPITVQTMTNTLTADADATIEQIHVQAGMNSQGAPWSGFDGTVDWVRVGDTRFDFGA